MNASKPFPQPLDSTFEAVHTASRQLDSLSPLAQVILEGLPDGILIVSMTGKILQANRLGRALCQKVIDRPTDVDAVPKTIWRLCKALIDSRETFADCKQNIYQIEDEILGQNSGKIRVRTSWFNEDTFDSRIFIVLEDRFKTACNRAITEGIWYRLTKRESEVWKHRSFGSTYQQIAEQLFITVNTVKKHVKNIYAKREMFQTLNEESEGSNI